MNKKQMIEAIYKKIETRWYNIKLCLHAIFIGDVLEWQMRNDYVDIDWQKWSYLRAWIVERWDNYSETLEEQSIDCIKFIYNLIK